jgi:transporter family protein
MKQWLAPALGAFVFWGFSGFIPKFTIRYIAPKSAILFETLGGMIVAFTVLWSLNFRPDIHPKGILLAMATGALGFSGQLLFYHAILRGPISLVAVICGLYPIGTTILAATILQEPITLKHGLGIVLGLASMTLIASP